MSAQIVILERNRQNVVHYLYVLEHPAFQITEDHHLVVAPDQESLGKVEKIKVNDSNHYQIEFANSQKLVLNKQKVVSSSTNPKNLTLANLLANEGFKIAADVAGASPKIDFQSRFSSMIPSPAELVNIPEHYIVIDCEFGEFFERNSTCDQIRWKKTKINGLATGIYQLSAISYAGDTQTQVFFNHYVDNPRFSPEKRLAGLAETGLTLAAFQRQSAPLLVLKQFIAEVVAAQLPLVFWDQTFDLKCLRWLFATYFEKFTKQEQALLLKPIKVFDGELFTNMVINRSNKKSLATKHMLPLSGVAGLLNIVNPKQHNAIWDVQTTHRVLSKMATILAEQPEILSQPAPSVPAVPSQATIKPAKAEKYDLVRKLHATGNTYREIADQLGISVSGVNYILKKAVTN
ncbi:winged helix-turn-helix transcriptional regulator [Lactiplantibacillus fabifermentans]|uniref:Uncharacterized protein n=1 Tax=Lactiplantibacillus fabifermentans DSM 21115 TaxID=1413187 RepID=A0A0R2NJG9_9LACO|nr:winged helix-turn-helix transcriptional regulator [Lactiplantibacillus fabifermentans]KRO25909.1 hypothetical protein DY78_GL001101 [Lactiplantibacillus fabifermentans DSM 21115]